MLRTNLICFSLLLGLLFPFFSWGQHALTEQLSEEIDKVVKEGDYNTALKLSKELLEAYNTENNDTLYASTLSACAKFNKYIGNYDEAEDYYKKVIKAYEPLYTKQSEKYAAALNNLASLYKETGRYQEEEALYQQAMRILEGLDLTNSGTYIAILNNLAILYYYENHLNESAILMARVLEYDKQQGAENSLDYAYALGNYASVLYAQDKYEEAQKILLESIEIMQKQVSPTHPDVLMFKDNLASSYQHLGRYNKALGILKELRDLQENRSKKDQAFTLNNIGTVYLHKKQLSEAVEAHQEAAKLYEEGIGKATKEYANTLFFLAKALYFSGDYEQAQARILESIELDKQNHGDITGETVANYSFLIKIFIAKGQLDSALAISQQLITPTLDQSGFAQFLSQQQSHTEILLSTARIYKKRFEQNDDPQELEKATQTLQKVLELSQYFLSTMNTNSDKLSVVATRKAMIPLMAEIVLLDQHVPARLERLFQFAENNKSVLLVQTLRSDYAQNFGGLPDSVAQQEKEIQAQVAQARRDYLNAPTQTDKRTAALSILNQALDEANRFKNQLSEKFPQYYQLKYRPNPTKINEIQQHLPTSAVMIEYLLSDSASYALIIDQQKSHLIALDFQKKELHKQIRLLREALTTYHAIGKHNPELGANFVQPSSQLYQMLIAPLQSAIEDYQHLIFIPSEQLGHLPFETLLSNKPQNPADIDFSALDYLVRDYQISYAYSATVWLENHQNQEKKQNNGQLFAVAANYSSVDSNVLVQRDFRTKTRRNHLIPLAGVEAELQQLEQTFKGEFLYKTEANERNFANSSGNYSVIHLAMHGLLDRDYPIFSSLAFTENGDSSHDNFLHAYEIAELQLNADLVVLSACETGFGRFQEGEGIMSLARSFMYAGVPSQLVSLWQVNDQTTAILMKNFYANLADGQNKAEALQKAKLVYLDNAKELSAHPAFWSPFILLGNSTPIDLERQASGWWWWIGGGTLGLLVMIGGIRFLKRSSDNA